MTYLYCKNAGRSLEWAKSLDAKRYIWATPGPYLRKGMLASMSKVADVMYMPEAWAMELEQNTFVDAEGSHAKDGKAETDMGRKLSWKMEEHQKISIEDSDDSDDSDDE
jgi:hypothetical protein